MNLFNNCGIFVILIIGLGINSAYAQVDPLSEIVFFQTGELYTEESKFIISNDINIREFFNGNIIRISGQLLKAFHLLHIQKS